MIKYIFIFTLLSFQWSSAGEEIIPCNRYQNEVRCLVCNCYHEARGEIFEGQVAVSKVVLSRMQHSYYKGTACQVIYAKSQFSWTNDSIENNIKLKTPVDSNDLQRNSYNQCVKSVDVARKDGPNGLIAFHTKNVSPYWKSKMKNCGTVGVHIFYTEKDQNCPKYLGTNKYPQSKPSSSTQPSGVKK